MAGSADSTPGLSSQGVGAAAAIAPLERPHLFFFRLPAAMARLQAMATRWKLPLAALAVALGLVLRIVHRGPYAFGWEFVSAARGLHDLATYTPRQLWALSIAHYNGVLTAPWNIRGLLTVVPGALTWLWPWEYWSHVLTAG